MTKRHAQPLRGPIRAAIYCRISLARFGDTLKVDDQEKLCQQVAAQRGWTVLPDHVFKDPNRSAWQRNRKRPGWDAMLAAVERGEIDAIIVYHGDRLIRQPWDLELLFRIVEEKGVRLASPTGERDLDNPDDQFILRIEAAQACRESDNTSRRAKREYNRLAELGITRLGGRGGRAFGFEPDGLTVRARDAEMIVEAADRVLGGEGVGAIARDLNVRGYTTTAGNPWDHGSLRKLLCRARLAGLVSHHGVIVGPARWAPILDREKWESVVAVLDNKSATFDYTTNARRYLLTGIAICVACSQPVAIRHNTRSESLRGYGCITQACTRKVHRSVKHLDAYVEGAVLALLNEDSLRDRMRPKGAGHLAAELARLETRRQQILEEFGDADAAEDPDAADVLRVSLRRNRERTDDVRSQIAAQRGSHVLDQLWGMDRARWDRLGLSRQRAAVQALMTVVIKPSNRRGPGFDPRSVELIPREPPPSSAAAAS
jgi:DNA invertase Pin-like site-specific DNA recombinase